MLKLLTNITSIGDKNEYLASNFYQLLKFIINNVSTSYMVCGFIIVLCMFATTFKNLIYKVLNLAVLSVFVVALWAYLTDVTFIYVVYILTFVSAVVMLFLSVVLMLPSSAIAVSKRNFSSMLLVAGNAGETSSFPSILKLCLAIAVVYFIYRLPSVLKSDVRAKIIRVCRNSVLVYRIRNTDIGSWIIASYVIDAFERVLRIFTSTADLCRGLLTPFTLHPAIIFKLANIAGFKMPIQYLPAYYYNSIINFIFTNIEAPKYLATGRKCGFGFLTPYYDNIIPAYSHNFPPLVYSINSNIGSNNKFFFIINFIIFIVVNGLFNIANIFVYFATLLTTPHSVELAAQVVTVISIFFIAVPFGIAGGSSLSVYSYYLVDAGVYKLAENLAAIQYGLYVQQPFLLLVSITGLLVALIGAPFFVSRASK